MSTVYTLTIFIESALTPTPGYPNILGGEYSLAGHMWWRINAYKDGALLTDAQRDAGYTSNGITNGDDDEYIGNPAYTSRTVQISESGYNTLKEFGSPGSDLAARLGFGPDAYNPVINSCVDYAFKAMSLAGVTTILST